jgi:hypothetical protein
MFRFFAQTYMTMRECMAPTQRLEAQTEVLADLHACIDQLKARKLELDARIERCRLDALGHLRAASREPTPAGRLREKGLARMCLEERRRVQVQHDKAQRMYHMLQMQVDGIAASSMDNLIVDAMRSYNLNAARMAMPARARQVSQLGDELSERQTELFALQEAIASVTLVGGEETDMEESEAQLMQELEALMLAPDTPTPNHNNNTTTEPQATTVAARINNADDVSVQFKKEEDEVAEEEKAAAVRAEPAAIVA